MHRFYTFTIEKEAQKDSCPCIFLMERKGHGGIQGNCYGYFEAKKTWEEAEIECQSYHRGTHLASILTLAETLVVANHIMSYQTKPSNVWIGLHDIRHNGKWRWSNESTYNYKAWMLGKPNLRTKEYCVELVHFTKWNNTACHKLNAYICKHEL
ncbi:C-type lectin Cal-like [Thamnophis elegans]|uniref:C-type lectin Cal-like n=1 Tax=Thamnophis elegans TaxID=35005 RepID=UPI0013780012|nr:C-type lectin Cal-like [Thamnophis elegans]